MRITMDKAYLKRVGAVLIAAVVCVALVAYIGYHISKFLTKEVATIAARETEHMYTVRCDGYVFRSERAIEAPASGSCVAAVADATHVYSGEQLGAMYSNPDALAEANLAALRKHLALLTDLAATNRGAKDAAAVDDRIYSILTQMKTLGAQNDLAGVGEMRAELIAQLNERDVASGVSSDNFEELIASVKQSIASETGKLGSLLAPVYAPKAGWYFASTDGYESVFRPELLDTLTPSSFDELTASAAKETSADAGKLVLDFKWYLAFKTGIAEAALISESNTCAVSFAYSGGVTLSMKPEHVVPDYATGEALVVLSSGQMTSGFSFARCQTIDVTVERLSGFSVPRSAVRIIDGQQGVYIFDGVYANFRRIDVLREFDDYFLVKTDGAIKAEEESISESISRENEQSSAETTASASPGEASPEPITPSEVTVAPGTNAPEPVRDPDGTEATPSEGGAQSETEEPFDASKAPFLAENDLIVVEGKGLYDGKIIS